MKDFSYYSIPKISKQFLSFPSYNVWFVLECGRET